MVSTIVQFSLGAALLATSCESASLNLGIGLDASATVDAGATCDELTDPPVAVDETFLYVPPVLFVAGECMWNHGGFVNTSYIVDLKWQNGRTSRMQHAGYIAVRELTNKIRTV